MYLNFSGSASNNIPEDANYSKKDRKFLSLDSNGIRQTDVHHEISLPFRQQDVKLPYNREQALKRVLRQKKKDDAERQVSERLRGFHKQYDG